MTSLKILADGENPSRGRAHWGDLVFPCALGKGGLVPRTEKREGDGKTPLGRYAMRRLFYRADRMAEPETALPGTPISKNDGWCDAPDDICYNRLVSLPYPASAERLWRANAVYDLIVILGHNDDPVMANMGSAIFLHIARDNFSPTAGCVALAEQDLLTILKESRADTYIDIRSPNIAVPTRT